MLTMYYSIENIPVETGFLSIARAYLAAVNFIIQNRKGDNPKQIRNSTYFH
jgi:hypothetical protein